MTKRQWIIIVALMALVCAVYAILANMTTTFSSPQSIVTPFVLDVADNKTLIVEVTPEPTNTATAAPTDTPLPTAVPSPRATPIPPSPALTIRVLTSTRAISAPITRTTIRPAPTSTAFLIVTIPPTPSPNAMRTATATWKPAATVRAGTLIDALINPFAAEAYRRRAQRVQSDADYTRRVDQGLNQGRINFLLFGYGETNEPPAAEGLIIGSLSIISYNTRTGRADIVSLTHDTRAPEIERLLAARGKPSGPVKIDQAYSVGGFDLMRRTMEDATGLSVDLQVVFRDSALLPLVDNVYGGIEIENPADFKVGAFYLDGARYDEGRFGQGRQALNGTQTIQYIKAITTRYDRSLERNVRKLIVLRALLDGMNQKCKEVDFWLRLSSFVVGQSTSKAIQYDFDPLGLIVGNLREVMSDLGGFARGQGCDVGASRIGNTVYVVDPMSGDGGVQWLAMEVQKNPTAKRDVESGVYPENAAFELPINGNPYGDLVSGYWQSVRSLVKQRLSR